MLNNWQIKTILSCKGKLSQKKIAKKVRCSVASVQFICINKPIQADQVKTKLNRLEIASILELYANGMSLKDISASTKRCITSVSYALTKHYFSKRISETTETITLKSSAWH